MTRFSIFECISSILTKKDSCQILIWCPKMLALFFFFKDRLTFPGPVFSEPLSMTFLISLCLLPSCSENVFQFRQAGALHLSADVAGVLTLQFVTLRYAFIFCSFSFLSAGSDYQGVQTDWECLKQQMWPWRKSGYAGTSCCKLFAPTDILCHGNVRELVCAFS